MALPFFLKHRANRAMQWWYERGLEPYAENYEVRGISRQVRILSLCLEKGWNRRFLKWFQELAYSLCSRFSCEALFIPELDALALKAGTTLQQPAEPTKSIIHVATELYETGGHTRILLDIVRALPEYIHTIICTKPISHETMNAIGSGFPNLVFGVNALEQDSFPSISRFGRPCVVFLLNHPNDVASNIVASAERVIFLHHVDHSPCLGATRSDYVHVDLTPSCHEFCKRYGASMLDMTTEDFGVAKSSTRVLTAATCGNHLKYVGKQGFTYSQLLNGLFASGVKKVWHIGAVPEEQQAAIHSEVRGNICFVSNVLSLAKTLINIAPTFYFDSHPLGGGKAQIEALSVGLPILQSLPDGTPPLSKGNISYGHAVTIASLDDLPQGIERIKNEHAILSAESRVVYEQNYHPEMFRRNVKRLIAP